NAWPYRDYVIRSFNEDKPYARFVEEQLAGDVLFPNDPQGVVATGFIAAGPWDYSSQIAIVEDTVDKKIGRNLDRDDMVMTTMSTFAASRCIALDVIITSSIRFRRRIITVCKHASPEWI